MFLKPLLTALLLGAATAGARAQGTPTPPTPPLTLPPTTVETGRMQGREAKTVDPTETVTLDTNEVQMRVDPKKPVTRPKASKTAPKAKAKPRQ